MGDPGDRTAESSTPATIISSMTAGSAPAPSPDAISASRARISCSIGPAGSASGGDHSAKLRTDSE